MERPRNTLSERNAQGASRADSGSRIPRFTDAIFVGDGHVTCGWVVPDNEASFFAFAYTGELLGEYDNISAAVNSLPYIGEIGADA